MAMVAASIRHHRDIAITEEVCERIRDDYPTERLPDINLKWLDEPSKVWEVREGQPA